MRTFQVTFLTGAYVIPLPSEQACSPTHVTSVLHRYQSSQSDSCPKYPLNGPQKNNSQVRATFRHHTFCSLTSRTTHHVHSNFIHQSLSVVCLSVFWLIHLYCYIAFPLQVLNKDKFIVQSIKQKDHLFLFLKQYSACKTRVGYSERGIFMQPESLRFLLRHTRLTASVTAYMKKFTI